VQHRDPKTEEGKEEIAAETLTPSSIAKAGFPREHLVSSEGNVIHGPYGVPWSRGHRLYVLRTSAGATAAGYNGAAWHSEMPPPPYADRIGRLVVRGQGGAAIASRICAMHMGGVVRTQGPDDQAGWWWRILWRRGL